MAKRRRFAALDIAPLPIELIGRLLGYDLAPGIVHFSAANQDHSYGKHGNEFVACLEILEMMVRSPQFIGQSPRHPEAFELIRALPADDGSFALAAVMLKSDAEGRYAVQSLYRINYGIVRGRVRKKRLFPVEG